MTSNAHNLIDDIAADVVDALDRVGGVIVGELQEKLSTPVGVARGPRGGKIVVRSKRGEYPRMESRKLHDSASHAVGRDGDTITLTIDTPVAYAGHLQDKDRIVTSDVPDEYTETVADAISAAIAGE